MSNFAIIRLGKDSVADIRALDALHSSPAAPINLSVNCKQVPTELVAGDCVFLCFGSDNSQGAPTDWVRGVRALGKVVSKAGGPGYNDPWNVAIEIKVVLPQSVVRRDLLARAPTAYYWCSGVPIIGIEANSQQTVQMIKRDEPDQNVEALAFALAAHSPVFQTDTSKAYPDLADLFAYSPPAPGAPSNDGGAASAESGSKTLADLVARFRVDASKCPLRVEDGPAQRLGSALLSKRFLILTGLAGSGKTKMAQALARWITPQTVPADPFKTGCTIKGVQNDYTVVAVDAGIVELATEDGKLVPLPRVIIQEWADYIEANDVPESVSGRELRDKIEAESKITGYLHRLESHYKPAAFALVAARKSTECAKCFEVVPVGADWTGNENILGYPDGLQATNYVAKPPLDLILNAADHADVPHFLILDEMNLSHVERYFADVLSVIESDEGLELYSGDMEKPETWRKTSAGTPVPPRLKQLPENIFIIGTVNVDETTYMFSPKVLDRANVIEFRMDAAELEGFLGNPAKPDLSKLDGKGASFGKAFVDAAKNPVAVPANVKAAYDAEMLLLFKTLQAHGAEFGYRTAYETARFIHFYKLLGNHADGDAIWLPGAFDCVIFQKLLPKLHGSRAKLGPVLKKLWFLCVNDADGRGADALKSAEEAARSTDKKAEPSVVVPAGAPYPLSAEKIGRMWRLLIENGFASFAEA